MPRPIVEVLQTVANITTTVNDPEQSVLLVGPQYDITAFDPASAGAPLAEYNPYTGVDTNDLVSNEPYDIDIDVSSRGAIDDASSSSYPAVLYLDEARFRVGGGDSVVSKAANSDGALADKRNVLSLPSSIHTVAGYQVKSGDEVNIQFKQATRFVADAGQVIPDTHFTPSAVKILTGTNEVADFNGAGTTLFYDLAQHGKASSSEILLSDKVKGDFFSATDGQDPVAALTNPAGTAVTILLSAADQDDIVVVGELALPLDQRSVVASISEDGTELTLTDVVRQLALGGGDAEDDLARGLSIRVDRPVADAFTVPSSGLSIASSEWGIDAGFLNLNNPFNLRDTNLVGAASLDDSVLTRGNIYLAGRTLNTASSALAFSVSSNDFESLLGAPSVYNPLSLAASIALQNSGSSTVKVLRLAEDSAQGYQDARSFINADPDAYAIIPLTTDLSVINSFVTDAVTSSEQKYNFRIVIGASEGAPLRKYWAGSDVSYVDGDITADNNGALEILDPDASFLSSVSSGDIVKFYYANAPANVLTASVTSVDSNSILQVNVTDGNSSGAAAAIKFVGYADISSNKSEQVAVLNDRISTFSSQKRLVMVYPGSCTVLGEAGQPGYYLSAALGGMLAAFEPHRPKNNIAVSGIDDIAASNLGYFNDDQIDSLSDNGYFVFVQETSGGLPFCVHQVTCAYRDYAGTQEFSELSVVNNYDYVSKVFKNTLTPYVGTWNVIPQALASIASSLDSAILSLRARVVDRIGAPLRDAEIISVEESTSDAGTVVILLNVSLPKVLNKIQLTLESQ